MIVALATHLSAVLFVDSSPPFLVPFLLAAKKEKEAVPFFAPFFRTPTQNTHQKRNIHATKTKQKEDDLVITAAEEYREALEELDLLTKSLPIQAITSSQWQSTLRNSGDDGDLHVVVPVGNIFSGLFCKVKQRDRTVMKDTIRKPKKSVVSGDGQALKTSISSTSFLPGKGGASRRWKERSEAFRRRSKLQKRMERLKPLALVPTCLPASFSALLSMRRERIGRIGRFGN